MLVTRDVHRAGLRFARATAHLPYLTRYIVTSFHHTKRKKDVVVIFVRKMFLICSAGLSSVIQQQLNSFKT